MKTLMIWWLLLNGVAPAPNGIKYMPEYKNWQVVNVTHRHDNNTLRIIYGNPVAINAIRKHQTNPWPNGSILAKVAFVAVTDSTGFVAAGDFQQVQFMIKKNNEWGWARWTGPELKPYGKTATFSQECISCHTPKKDVDFVFTDPYTSIYARLHSNL